jgi:hypothetical protein
MASLSKTTQDHEEIRRWAEERGGKPSHVKSTESNEDIGILRIDFPGFSGEGSLEEISWDEWFQKFDDRNLALLFQETTAEGQKSNFNKIVSAETAAASESKRGGGRAAKKKSAGAKKKAAPVATKKAVAKKAAPKKAAAKKAGPRTAAPKKAVGKKATGKKAVAKKAAPKKAAPKKAAPKKAAAKKAVKKTATKKAATKKRR